MRHIRIEIILLFPHPVVFNRNDGAMAPIVANIAIIVSPIPCHFCFSGLLARAVVSMALPPT